MMPSEQGRRAAPSQRTCTSYSAHPPENMAGLSPLQSSHRCTCVLSHRRVSKKYRQLRSSLTMLVIFCPVPLHRRSAWKARCPKCCGHTGRGWGWVCDSRWRRAMRCLEYPPLPPCRCHRTSARQAVSSTCAPLDSATGMRNLACLREACVAWHACASHWTL